MKFNKTQVFMAAALLGATAAHARDWPASFSKCADEGERCEVGAAPRQVSFGIKDKWVVVQGLKGSVACDVSTFGPDPYPGKTKKCAIGPAPAQGPAPTPAPTLAPTPAPAPAPGADASTEAAPATGWAGQAGGTTGGRAAASNAIYKVSSPSQLLAALQAQGDQAKIIKVYGTIDMASADNGGPFKSASDQAARNAIKLPSNTTLIGVGGDAEVVNGRIVVKGVENVIVRNLRIVNPCDIAPQWDPNDGSSGNWNSEYDGLVVDGSRHVWLDHNVFTDAPLTDDRLPVEHGKTKQCHDGALDVKNGSDYVTISHTVFELHAKNNLIGSSDSASGDDGHLTVTFHDNHFLNVAERAPRVRFGKVHLYNNYHEGSRSHAAYAHGYSVGVGYKAKIISQNNAYDIDGASSCAHVVKNPGSSSKTGAISDAGSLLNGAALNLAGNCNFSSAVGWTVPYRVQLLPASAVKASVRAKAGVGKITVK